MTAATSAPDLGRHRVPASGASIGGLLAECRPMSARITARLASRDRQMSRASALAQASPLRALRALVRAGIVLAAFAALMPGTAGAAGPDDGKGPIVIYEVHENETLTGIANHLLKPELTWRHLRAFNQLTDANRLSPGQQLRVPRAWLRAETVQAFVRESSGQVELDGKPLQPTSRLEAGNRLRTGPDGVVVVVLPDGTSVRVAPETDVRFERLQRAKDTQGIDARFDIERGEVTIDAPKNDEQSQGRRIELHSPKAVAAVRGTRFRVREAETLATSAVLRGAVAWAGKDTERLVPAGFGSSADVQGRTTVPEPLLPAPRLLLDGDGPIRTPTAEIRFEQVGGARAYRMLISRDEAAVKAVQEAVLVSNAFSFESPEDGPFYIHLRAISNTGIEGLSEPVRFVVSARPLPPALPPGRDTADDEGRASLEWPARADAGGYLVQFADNDRFTPVLLERRVGPARLAIDTDLLAPGPGSWFWRVAGVGEDGQAGPFTGARSLVRSINGPPVTAQVALDRVTLQWPLPREGDPELVIEPLSQGASPLSRRPVDGTSLSLQSLAPGRYRASLNLLFAGGRRSQAGPAAEFTVPLLLRDSDGRPVGTSTGPIKMNLP
ncbi:MAG: FecR domain-containing protein [Burkholderiaceae bacterium]